MNRVNSVIGSSLTYCVLSQSAFELRDRKCVYHFFGDEIEIEMTVLIRKSIQSIRILKAVNINCCA